MALEAAWELKALNDRRKDMTAKNVDDAIYYIEETGIKQDERLCGFPSGMSRKPGGDRGRKDPGTVSASGLCDHQGREGA